MTEESKPFGFLPLRSGIHRESKPSASPAPVLMEHRESKTFGFLPLRSDGTIAPGTLACTTAGGLIVHVEAERHRIAPEDVKALIFAGRPAPVTRERVRRTGGIVAGSVTIEGHAAVNPAGRAVVVHLRAGCWIVPLVSLRRVARGEAASAPLFPLVLEDIC